MSIARALVKDPRLLLLDEATSSLDAESEKKVQQALENAVQDRTVLVVAHRLSTVKNANEILVMDSGTFVESGTHADLVEAGGTYSSLVQHQLADDTALASGSGSDPGTPKGSAKAVPVTMAVRG